MAYNLLNVAGIDFKSYPLVLTNVAADIIAAIAAGSALELETITLANTDATTAYDGTISYKLNGGTSYVIVPAVTIQPKQALILPLALKLMTGDSLTGFGSTTLKITAVAAGKLYT